MNNPRILAVDDEPFNLEIIEEYLEVDGYEIHTAEDGLEAWSILEQGANRYDAILLDRMMPQMDGMAVLARIKGHSELKRVPVVFQTARAEKEDLIDGLQAGAYYYLTKPFEEEALRSIARAAVSERRDYSHWKNRFRSTRIR